MLQDHFDFGLRLDVHVEIVVSAKFGMAPWNILPDHDQRHQQQLKGSGGFAISAAVLVMGQSLIDETDGRCVAGGKALLQGLIELSVLMCAFGISGPMREPQGNIGGVLPDGPLRL
jgi:hypothetical protein